MYFWDKMNESGEEKEVTEAVPALEVVSTSDGSPSPPPTPPLISARVSQIIPPPQHLYPTTIPADGDHTEEEPPGNVEQEIDKTIPPADEQQPEFIESTIEDASRKLSREMKREQKLRKTSSIPFVANLQRPSANNLFIDITQMHPPPHSTHTQPKSYTTMAWLSCLLCCPLVGIIAVYKSSQVLSAFTHGDYELSKAASLSTYKFANAACSLGAGCYFVFVIFSVIFFWTRMIDTQ